MSCDQAAIVLYIQAMLFVILALMSVPVVPACECNAPGVSGISAVILDTPTSVTLVISWQPNIRWNTTAPYSEGVMKYRCIEAWRVYYRANNLKHLYNITGCDTRFNSSAAYPYYCPEMNETACHLNKKCFLSYGELEIKLVGLNNCRISTEIHKTFLLGHAIYKAMPVTNLSFTSLASRSATIEWNHFNSSLIVEYHYNVSDWLGNIVASTYTSHSPIVLMDLMPNSSYSFVLTARYKESLYHSDPRSISFSTLEDVPTAEPVLSEGSYSLCRSDSINCFEIYYQDVLKSKQHGEIIQYFVNITSYAQSVQIHNETWTADSNSKMININTEVQSYLKDGVLVDVRAATKAGLSAVSAQLYIINPKSLPAKPEQVSAEMHNESFVLVHWNNSAIYKAGSAVQSWTLHYCEGPYRKSPVMCMKNYQFVTLPGNVSDHLIYLPFAGVQAENYRFGVSMVTTENISSGITWSDCLYNYSGVPVAPTYKVLNKTDAESDAVEIVVNWEVTCKELTSLTRMISVNYQLHDGLVIDCGQGGTVQNASWSDMANTTMVISHLLAARKYMVCVRAYSRHGPGAWSDQRIIRTASIPSDDFPLAVIIVLVVFILVLLLIVIGCCWPRWKKLCRDPETDIPKRAMDDGEPWDGYTERVGKYEEYDYPSLPNQMGESLSNGTTKRELSVGKGSNSSTMGLLDSPPSRPRLVPGLLPHKSTSNRKSMEEAISKLRCSQPSTTYHSKHSTSEPSIAYLDMANNHVLESKSKSDEAMGSSGYESQNGSDLENGTNLCDHVFDAVKKNSKNSPECICFRDGKSNSNARSMKELNLAHDTEEGDKTEKPSIKQSLSPELHCVVDLGVGTSSIKQNTPLSLSIDTANDVSLSSNDCGSNDSPLSGNTSYSKLTTVPDKTTCQNKEMDRLIFTAIVADSFDKYSNGDVVDHVVDNSPRQIRTFFNESDKLPETLIQENIGSRNNPDLALDTQIIMKNTMFPVVDSNMVRVVHEPSFQHHTAFSPSKVDTNISNSMDNEFVSYLSLADIDMTVTSLESFQFQ